jgi:hypothetical protein
MKESLPTAPWIPTDWTDTETSSQQPTALT